MHGAPLQAFSDNVLQYSFTEFSESGKSYKFFHTTSKIIVEQWGSGEPSILPKHYFRKLKIHVQHYWHTGQHQPICGYSPAELLMNKQLCLAVPIF